MDGILYIRAVIISVIKKYETVLLFIIKFFSGLLIFSSINKLGFLREELMFLAEPPTGLVLLVILAFLFSVFSFSSSFFLMSAYVAANLSLNPEIAVTVLLFLLCVLFFYARLAPKENILILIMLFGYYFKLPYFAPMFAGLYFGLTSVIPIAIGVFIWHFIPVVTGLMKASATAGLNIMEMTDTIPEIYQSFLSGFSTNYEWIYAVFTFTMVIVTVYAVSKLSVNYSAEISILLGSVVNIIGFIAAVFAASFRINIFGLFFSTLASAALLCAIKFFDIALDYTKVERVQFSDDENYYYVKIVPKLLMASKMKKRKNAAGTERER